MLHALANLRRCFDATPFNAIANRDDVRPWLGGCGPLDFSKVVEDPANVCLLGDGVGFIMHKLMDGMYEVHSMAAPLARGGYTLACVREGMRYMFCATDCVELVTKCPDGNSAALGLARASGFRECFRRERALAIGLEAKGVAFHRVDLDRWRARDPVNQAAGQWFHQKLEAAKNVAGSPLDSHPVDPAHDCALGASLLMVLAGNPRKAVWAYNRWAVFAGYAPIMLVSESPIIIDVVDALVAPRGDDMEVLLCREERSQR